MRSGSKFLYDAFPNSESSTAKWTPLKRKKWSDRAVEILLLCILIAINILEVLWPLN